MSDLISRQDAIDAMYRLEAEDIETYGCSIPEGFDAKPAVEALEALPSAEPERKKGEWRHLGGDEWCCTNCGYVLSTEGAWEHPKEQGKDYCEHCGADMRGEYE